MIDARSMRVGLFLREVKWLMKHYDPAESMLGGFTSRDGTVEFYSRINAILQPGFKVLDLGAGRGAWHYTEKSEYKRRLREIRGKVGEYIGADVDPAVLNNPTTDKNMLITDGVLPVEDGAVDVVMCDWVLEHIVDVESFKSEVWRVLKRGGYFCARTPHSMSYVSLVARVVRNSSHVSWLRWVQPRRKAEDAFPTAYRCNTLKAVAQCFQGWEDFSYIYSAEPSYYFGRKPIFELMNLMHRWAPRAMTGSLFIFLRKT
jgi:ubiquinone/menaquinone biosynthesis C-methylase UbiE